MTTITTRSGKGSPLTNDEVDANFTNLNDDKLELDDLSDGTRVTGTFNVTDLDVSGTVTADGLTVSNSSANAEIVLTEGQTNTDARIRNSNGILQIGADINDEFGASELQLSVDGKEFLTIERTGDISFYDSAGSSQSFFWDASAEFLGVGTSSPLAHLDVKSDTGSVGFNYGTLSSPSRGNLWYDTDGSGWKFDIGKVQSGSFTSQVTIQDNGRVGIGTSSPTDKLNISSASNQIGLDTGDQTTYGTLDIGHFTNGAFIGTQAGSNAASNLLRFGTSGSERMRIDASGNLLVGTTTPVIANSAVNVGTAIGSGLIESARAGVVAQLNRHSTDGRILDFQKDGTTVGSIGTSATANFNIRSGQSGHVGLEFGSPNIMPMKDGALADNAVDLGISSQRFKDLYLSGGVYLGGTGAANKLDDYEEGTFTPAENNLTFTVATGRYTKIGNLVHAVGYVEVPINTNGNTFDISLPFASGDSSSLYFTCSVTSTALADTAGLLGPAGSEYIAVTNKDTEARTLLSAASGKAFRFNITYRTA